MPNVLARVESYAALRKASSDLGSELVVQLPFGDSGQTTFFIGDEGDYARHAAEIEAAPEVKIMRRIRCRQAANPPESHQRRTAERLKAVWHELDTGHYPMLSEPDALTRLLQA